MRNIHYLIRKPENLGELIYPIELTDPHYQGQGSFFADGRHPDDVDSSYVFYAVRDAELIPVRLRRIGAASFQADIIHVGSFIFRATTIGVPARYAGRYPFPSGNFLVRQFSPSDRIALERAAFDHDFYFAGYSPQIDAAALDEPIAPKL